MKLKVQGKELLTENKQPPRIAADGIALDAKDGFLYYHALTGHTLYRIKTEYLEDAKLSADALAAKVEKLGETPAPDGMLAAEDGSVYLTAIEQSAILRWNPRSKQLEPVIKDERLSWPDTLSWGPDGSLYVTASQIHHMPRFNNGKSTRTEPYRLFRISGLNRETASE